MENPGRYGKTSKLVDYIYGITFEIWEEKGVELIRQYYAEDLDVYALSGYTKGVEPVVSATYDTLTAYPDRLLLAENVVWSDDRDGEYSSHRIISPMTNSGPSLYGPPTNTRVFVRTIADCLVSEGQIIREWLIRDTLPLVKQLGFEPQAAAKLVADGYQDATLAWFAQEMDRLEQPQDVAHEWAEFARRALTVNWVTGDAEEFAAIYPHYTVLHPDPLRIVSGLVELQRYAQALRASFGQAQISIDHIAVQPWAHHGHELAVRWSVRAKHIGDYEGLEATDKDVYILGSSHWRVVDNKILTDWTVFDGIGVLAQLV